MQGLLYVGSFWVFGLVTLVLGGAAALATGRAAARTWRTFTQVPGQMAILAGFVCFLHYALFGESSIALKPLGDALGLLATDPLAGLASLMVALRYGLITFVICTAIAFAGFRRTRAGQMERQYPWALRRTSLFRWAPKGDSAA